MATDTADRPSIEESYSTATNTSDLSVDPDHRKPVDVILAAGMTKSRLGQALIQLRAEWDRCEKPPKRTQEQIEARAAELPDKKGRPDVKRARVEALVWHARVTRERAMKLRGRSVVLGLLTDWALLRGVDVDLLSPALFHWLAPTCPVCDGLGKLRRPDAPVLGIQCYHCHGAGTWVRPLGASDIHEHIADCVGKARSGMAGKLRGGY
jgi:hypothetical protein